MDKQEMNETRDGADARDCVPRLVSGWMRFAEIGSIVCAPICIPIMWALPAPTFYYFAWSGVVLSVVGWGLAKWRIARGLDLFR